MAKTTAAPVEEWRIDVDLVDEQRDFTIKGFTKKGEAEAKVQAIIKEGFVLEDKEDDPSHYDCHVHPVDQIRKLSIRKVMIDPATGKVVK